jgi:hypothetical protein
MGQWDNPPLTVWLFPGGSLMDVTWLSVWSAIVRCPGSGASQLVLTAAVPATFVHEDENCPILRRIEAAIGRLE